MSLTDSVILDLLPVAAYVCDRDGHIVRYNRKAVELWGYTPLAGEEAKKFCACHRVYTLEGRFVPHDQTPMAFAVNDGRSFRDVEAIVERPDGSTIIARVHIDPIRDASGSIIGAINCFEDVTEHKQVQARLKKAEAQLSELQADLSPPIRQQSA